MVELDLAIPAGSDDEETPFRRRMAVLAIVIVLAGTVIAYGEAVESNREDAAATRAARAGIGGFAPAIGAATELQREVELFVAAALVERDAFALGGAEVEPPGVVALEGVTTTTTSTIPVLPPGRDQWVLEVLREELAGSSRLVADAGLTPERLAASLAADSARPRLEEEAQAVVAGAHGAKADGYVAALTTVAVALSLLGLSLTVRRRGRLALAGPGLALAAAAVIAAAATAARSVPEISRAAIDATADGQRLVAEGDPDDAIASFDAAIASSPEFAAAYVGRSEARFLAGIPEGGGPPGREAVEAAIADANRALELGSVDAPTVANLGRYHLIAGDFDQSARHSRTALEQRPDLADLWFQLGAALLAGGDAEGAAGAYEQGVGRIATIGSGDRRARTLAAARSDLEVVRALGAGGNGVRRAEERLAASELRLLGVAGPELEREGVRVAVEVAGEVLQPRLDDRIPVGTPLLAVWYHRPNGQGGAFVQPAGLTAAGLVGDDGVGSVTTGCLPEGTWQVRLWSGPHLLGSAETAVVRRLGPLQRMAEPGLGASFCAPVEFRPLVGVVGGTTFAAGPESLERLSVSIYTFPAVPDDLAGDPAQVVDGYLFLDGRTDEGPADAPPLRIVTTAGEERLDPARMVKGRSGRSFVAVIGSLGRDGIHRQIRVVAPDAPTRDELAEVVGGTAFFSGPPLDP